MENLIIEASKYTPRVSFTADTLEFSGESYPENLVLLSAPIFAWLNKYLEQLGKQTFTVNVTLTYFNSSSSKMLLNLFDRLEQEVKNNGKNIIVNWIYESDDYGIEEYGEEFQEELEFLTFNLVPKSD